MTYQAPQAFVVLLLNQESPVLRAMKLFSYKIQWLKTIIMLKWNAQK